MSGKPAARQGDMTRKGLDIVQGSAGVLIGAPTGVACSVCPNSPIEEQKGNPVNPLLGAKVLPGETDLALPGPLPFILSRAYSSYRTRTPAPVGVFGPGWKAPFDIRLQVHERELILNDSGGRSIHFEPLFPGEVSYSRSESFWLARGGVAEQHSSQPLSALWQVLPEDVRLSPHVYLATNSLQGPWWILSWPERVPGADEVLPPPPPAYRVLTGVVEWLTYGSGYLAGMKLGGTPLVEYTRDRLHRETVRSFGSRAGSNAAYELTSTYPPAGQLQSQHLNSLVYDRDYGWNDNGDLVRISGPRQTREYGYSATGRLESVRTLAPDLDIRIPYATDPAGNRLPDPELHPDSTLTAWPDNRIAEDAHYVYHYDEYGRLTEKTDRIPTGVIRTDDERTHHYHYDPLGRRMAKRVWRRERDLTGWMSLSRKPEETWYGWDGDRLTTVQTDTTRIQTVYQPGSFAPLIRIETDNGEREKAQCRSLAEKIQQEGSEDGHGVVFPAELVGLLDRLEGEIRANCVSSESRQWLAQCGLTVERLAAQIEPVYLPERKIHLYHCDHRGLPLALISEDGNTAWSAEYDEWGNQLNEENPHHLHQPYRLPGQQYDKESGLYYNRHRYYDPLQGRYITPDPIGLRGGWNMYQYPLNPIQVIDPMGLDAIENMTSGGLIYAVSGVPGLIAANSITNSAYQFGYDMDAIVGGAHNGAADAMRHCYLMCRMTKTFGSTIADVIGKNHEAAGDRQGQPAKERIMDLKNNTVGIACGDFSAKCSDACIEKYNTGQLFGLDGIKADNPIKAKQGSSDASNY
ncbi:RHS repeat protein [Escherichia coli]|nr:RHS repeat protein [Escherichia coli]MBI1083229.1 RHS repeat protein [Escherichia coli]HDW3878418.1 RHS repeat protein [Escherichia coli]HDW3901881.1 RHS repeat protein [Escherichia coli]